METRSVHLPKLMRYAARKGKKDEISALLGQINQSRIGIIKAIQGCFADAPVNRTPLFTSYAWFACMAVLGGMAKYADFENKFTSFMTKKSWGLYVFHYLGISMVAIWLVKPGFISAVPAYLLSTIAAFAVAFVLYEIISRIPVYRWMVLGIKKDKKRN